MLSHSAAIPCIASLRRYLHAPPSLNLQTGPICCRLKKSNFRFTLSPAALPFDLSPPPIDLDPLESVTFSQKDGTTNTYSNDDDALDASGNSAVVVDLSDYGRIRDAVITKPPWEPPPIPPDPTQCHSSSFYILALRTRLLSRGYN